jgi:hypothetical protein
MTDAVSRRRGAGRDALIFLLVIVLSAGLVGGLYLVARDADSAGTSGLVTDVPTPNLSAADVCQNWADYWTRESGVNVPVEALEQISNCRETTAGAWIVPIGLNDPRIARPVTLSVQEAAATARLRNGILQQISRMSGSLPDDVRKGINRLHSSVADGVVGNVRPDVPIGATRGAYSDYLKGLADNPNYTELVSYIRWLIASRQAGFDQLNAACSKPELKYLAKTCTGSWDSLGIGFAPWPWDLKKTLNLDPYLKAVATGQTPPPDGHEVQTVPPEATVPD